MGEHEAFATYLRRIPSQSQRQRSTTEALQKILNLSLLSLNPSEHTHAAELRCLL